MSKKEFIALADAIRDCNKLAGGDDRLTFNQLDILADFCQSQNPRFDRQRWLDYIECGPNVGAKKQMTPQEYDKCFAQGDSINKI